MIKKEDLGFDARTQICGMFSNKYNKSIDIIVNTINKRVWYEVKHFGNWVYKGPSLNEVLDIFNKIDD